MTEDKMVKWNHRLNGHKFRLTPVAGNGQGGLVCMVHRVTKSRTQLSD